MDLLPVAMHLLLVVTCDLTTFDATQHLQCAFICMSLCQDLASLGLAADPNLCEPSELDRCVFFSLFGELIVSFGWWVDCLTRASCGKHSFLELFDMNAQRPGT